MKLSCPYFKQEEMIPQKYTCQGKNINPPLKIEDIPEEAKSLALIVDDPDAPGGTFVHWVVFNIPPQDEIKENSVPGIQGVNDFQGKDYGGPCPPSGSHRYYFKIYALDTMLNLKAGVSKSVLENEMAGRVIQQAELMGYYKKQSGI